MKECDIFMQAMEIEAADDREAFLRGSCGEDVALRQRIDQLLLSHEQDNSVLEHPAFAANATEIFGTTDVPRRSGSGEVDLPAEAAPLDFLEPSEQPDSLGRIGRYEITEVIGRGGMGVVLKGHDTKLNRVAAIKALAPELAANSTARKRFRRESQAAAAVSHDHVVTIFAIEDSEPPYLVMEYIDGQSLQQKIDAEGTLDVMEILRIGRQIARGLAAAHEQGLIHRDVKPSNILLQNGVERAKITDFGLARAVDDVDITRTGQITGTPHYMSPEQAQGLKVDTRSDLFSLGCVLYAMCAGRSPFRAENTIAAIRRVCDESPRPIREVNSEIPDWLAEIIDRLLAKSPDERFQSASEVAELLGEHLAHLQDPASAPFPGPDSKQDVKTSRRRWLAAASALVVAMFGVGLAEATGVTRLTSTVIRLATGEGTLVIEIDDPTIEVSLDGEELSISGRGIQEIKLRPGQHQFRATRNGKPVKSEIVSITRNGRTLVRVTRESPGLAPQIENASPKESATSSERGAFVVLGQKGFERKFDTLADAVANSSPGDTIEIRGNGPFLSGTVVIPHRLTVRAVVGFRPVLRSTPAIVATGRPLIKIESSLVLEGISLERTSPLERPHVHKPPAPEIHLLVAGADATLLSLNCRFYNVHGPCVAAQQTLVARNCEFIVGQFPHRDLLDLRASTESRYVIDNSVLTSHCMLHLPQPEPNGVSLQLTRNSTIGTHAVVLSVDGLPDANTLPDGDPPLHIEARENLFAVPEGSEAAVVLLALPMDFPPNRVSAAEESLPRILQWREAQNVYQSGRPLFNISLRKEEGIKARLLKTTRGENLADWNRLWELHGTGSIDGPIQFQPKSIYSLVQVYPEETTAEDFRLRPESAGYRADPDGKDLGADIDLVGPGKAYERFKKTPEYANWLEKTAKLIKETGE